MRNTLIIVFFLLSVSTSATVVLAEVEPGTFLKLAEEDIKRYTSFLPENRKTHWQDRLYSLGPEIAKLIARVDKVAAENPELEPYLRTNFVEDFQRLQLNTLCEIHKGIGVEILAAKISEIRPFLDTLDHQFSDIRSQRARSKLEQAYRNFLSIRDELNRIQQVPTVKKQFHWTKKDFYVTQEEFIGDYFLFDWDKEIEAVSEAGRDLNAIRREFTVVTFVEPKDPYPFITVGVQMATLLITVAGYVISFTGKKSAVVVAVLVATSLVLSFALIFVSADTVLNLVVQAVIPAGFMIYWLVRKANLIRKMRRQ